MRALKYQKGSNFLVSDRNYSMSVVTCNLPGHLEIWYLNCDDKIWKGDLGNCTSSTFWYHLLKLKIKNFLLKTIYQLCSVLNRLQLQSIRMQWPGCWGNCLTAASDNKWVTWHQNTTWRTDLYEKSDIKVIYGIQPKCLRKGTLLGHRERQNAWRVWSSSNFGEITPANRVNCLLQ